MSSSFGALPVRTWASFQPRFQVSITEVFNPCPAFGLWVWQASPARKTWGYCPSRESSNAVVRRWPIS